MQSDTANSNSSSDDDRSEAVIKELIAEFNVNQDLVRALYQEVWSEKEGTAAITAFLPILVLREVRRKIALELALAETRQRE